MATISAAIEPCREIAGVRHWRVPAVANTTDAVAHKSDSAWKNTVPFI